MGPTRPNSANGDELAVGKIYRPRGLEGEVFCEPLTDFVERFEGLEAVTVALPSGERKTLHLESARYYGKRFAVQFRECRTPEEAALLRGGLLLVPREQAHPIEDEDTFYVFEIVGMQVVNDAGEALGEVRDVLTYPANDVYVLNHGGREVLIPAVKEHVTIDREARRIVVRNLDGLL